MKKTLIFVGIAVLIATIYFVSTTAFKPTERVTIQSTPSTEVYNPIIDPASFGSKVDNRYFTLTPGTKYTYNETTKDGVEKIEVIVTKDTKQIMGVTTIVVRDTVWVEDVMKEDTLDYYAQDKEGNVWYFGEEVNNYENGKLINHSGSWKAGVDGALPGIVMKARPKTGDSYRQEYYKGEAEDMGDIVALNQTVKVPFGTFDNCLQTKDWSQIESQLNEYKYYCPDIGFLTAGDLVNEPGTEKLELVSVTNE